jgi:hypothetical protein
MLLANACTAEHDPPHVRPAVTVGVLEVPQVRMPDNEHSTVVAADRQRPFKVVGEDRALLELAIAVGVFK